MPDYDYYDETYYEEGHKKGTAYSNYVSYSKVSPTYKNVATNIKQVFQPRRVLEVGCATGIIVKHLNDLGVECYGIDVSKYAIENAEHENVRLASCDDLPFEDGYFDLIFSVHSLRTHT